MNRGGRIVEAKRRLRPQPRCATAMRRAPAVAGRPRIQLLAGDPQPADGKRQARQRQELHEVPPLKLTESAANRWKILPPCGLLVGRTAVWRDA